MSVISRYGETAFENLIENHLLSHGYIKVTEKFDRTRALFSNVAIAFIQQTQPKEWQKLEALHKEKTSEQVLTDLCKWMDTYGSLHTLRHGFKCYGRTLRIAYFKAAHGLNSDLERLYIFLRHLSSKLPRRSNEVQYDFDSEIQLEYYRLQKISEGSIELSKGNARPLDGPKDVGTGIDRGDTVKLSQLIDIINNRFGTDFNQADQLFFDQLVETAANYKELKQAARVNSADKFALLFKQMLDSLFVERVDQNEAIFARYMNDRDFQKIVSDWLVSEVYQRLTSN